MQAKRIAARHGPLTGLYFLAYTLLGIRQTGHLLLWYNGWFIVLEPKTGFLLVAAAPDATAARLGGGSVLQAKQ